MSAGDLDRISAYLRAEFDARAIVLCGSRAAGDAKPGSDWDFKAFVADPERHVRDDRWPELDGVDIDCTFHALDASFSFAEFGLKLRVARIVFDETGVAERVMDEAQRAYARGPEPWTRHYARARRLKVRRYEAKFRDLLAVDNVLELRQRLAWCFLEMTYAWWYGVRAEWEPRPQRMFDDLAERDPEFHELLLAAAAEGVSDAERVERFAELHRCFFSSEAYLEATR